MPRKHYYLSEKALELLPELAQEKGVSESAYISQIILDAADKNNETITQVLTEIKKAIDQLTRSEHANGKNISAEMDMFNTYFNTFANNEILKEDFYEVREHPHPWTTKALEAAEARIRMAKYAKTKDKDR